MITLIKVFERMFFYVLIFTAVGQIPFQGENLEKHYHEFVNSSGFQNFFWTLASPATWTVEKTASLMGVKIHNEIKKEIQKKEDALAR